MKPRVLLTRSGRQNEPLQSRLLEAGIEACVYPLQIVNPIEITDEELLRVKKLDEFDYLIFISRNAVTHGFECITQYWPCFPENLSCFAVGPGTANDLTDKGIKSAFPARGSSEDLLALEGFSAVKGKRILIVRGTQGREHLKIELEARGAKVEYLQVYDRQKTAPDVDLICNQLETEKLSIVIIHSGEALEHLSALIDKTPAKEGWRQSLNMVVPSSRIAEIAKRMGFGKVNVSSGAEVESMYSAIVKVYDSIS